ncbi:hypothetical protein LNQ52_21870 [Klebsiella pneumoniae subsp. pneumoniae]|nr:hypothetical protein [Klebsiella pneumoniae subsp. pneumoniae]
MIVPDVAAQTDTGRFAHIRFPALAWGEKKGTGHQLGAADIPSAQLRRRRGRRKRTGGSSPEWPGAGVSRGVCLAASA